MRKQEELLGQASALIELWNSKRLYDDRPRPIWRARAVRRGGRYFRRPDGGGATTFTGVVLKARAAHHWAMQRALGSAMSPRILAELFGIIAADLEILTARKAVQS